MDEIRRTLRNLPKYRNYRWEGSSADGYADSIESAIVLLNREAVPEGFDWVESEIQVLYGFQRDSGIVEGWHGDGNFARTALMYALMQSQGIRLTPWRSDVRLGAARSDDTLHVSVIADAPWQGRLHFDRARHRVHMGLDVNIPRLNEYPEWFTAEPGDTYLVSRDGAEPAQAELAEGLEVGLEEGELSTLLVITPAHRD